MTTSVGYMDKPWLKHYEKGIPETIQFEETCIPAFLERSAKEFPDHTALLFQGFKVTFRELNDMVNRFSACLSGFGIQKGDSVAILLPNVIPCVVSLLCHIENRRHCRHEQPAVFGPGTAAPVQ